MKKDPDTVRRTTLSNSTPIQIGIVGAILTVMATWVWWAATINAKLDTVIQMQKAQDGSLNALLRDFNDLRRRFEVHEASTPFPRP